MHAWMERRNLRSSVRSSGRFARSLVLSAALAGIGLASTAFAGFTTIQTPPLPGGETQAGLLDGIYGGTFTLEDGVDYSNGTLTAVRVSDTLPNTSSLSYTNPGPNATDQTWAASSLTATVKFSQAEYVSSPFGYFPGASGPTSAFVPLFSVTGGTFSASGTGSFSPSGVFRLGADNIYGYLSSSPSDNADGNDHMITYQIQGLPGPDTTWLVAFNDYGNDGTGSTEDAYYDFQNLVVQLQTLPASSTPEPGSLMVIGGLAIALLKRAPRRKA
jgi:hypothetical protein